MALFSVKRKPRPQGTYSAAPRPAGAAGTGGINIDSREYKIFRRKTDARFSWYERIARAANSVINMNIDEKTSKDLRSAIDFTGLRISENAPFSLLILCVVVFSFAGGFSYVLRLLPNVYGVIAFVLAGLGLGYYLLRYPLGLMKSMRIQASSQVVLAVLYMVVSMRISPNIERALRFTSSNISGVLAWDMRRLLWDIEMGVYYSANDALMAYIAKWKPENEEFSEALRMLLESQSQVPEKAEKTLDEALRVVLDGTRDRMKHYAQDLEMPVTVIHMMGVVLPIMGSIMAPMAAIFLSEMVSPLHFIVGYNIALPIVLVWFINNTLAKRPVTFSKVDIARHPDLPVAGSFMVRSGRKKISIPLLPIALVLAVLIALPSVMYFVEHPDYLVVPYEMNDNGTLAPIDVNDPDPDFTLLMSMFLLLGPAFGLSLFFIGSNVQRSRVVDTVYKMESEFELALFQLGNRISGGTPIEIAIEKANEDVKDLEISNLFGVTLSNMRNMGMTFEQALLNPNTGAVRYYPSRLIRNVMRTVTDTAKRGVQFASESMLTVSRYLKSVRETQEYMRTLLSETTSSMQFQAYGMAPLVTGLIVAMSQVIIGVLVFIGRRLDEFGFSDTFGIDPSSILGSTSSITPAMFQLIVGTYLMEVIIILAMFVTKINRGDDSSMQWLLAGKMLIIAMIVYSMVAIGSSMMFGGMIEGAMSTLRT